MGGSSSLGLSSLTGVVGLQFSVRVLSQAGSLTSLGEKLPGWRLDIATAFPVGRSLLVHNVASSVQKMPVSLQECWARRHGRIRSWLIQYLWLHLR